MSKGNKMSTFTKSEGAASGQARKSSFSLGRIWDNYGMLVVFAVLFIG